MPAEIHKYDKGTALTITIVDCNGPVNLVPATNIELIFYKPNKDREVVTPSVVTNGLDGKIRYITDEDDLDVIGLWKYQVNITFEDGSFFHSDKGLFKVHDNL